MFIEDQREQLAHLRETLNGHREWLLASDNKEGHLRLVLIASTAVVMAGESLFADMHCGASEVINRRDGRCGMISWLTILKERIGKKRMGLLLGMVGLPAKPKSHKQDIILVNPKVTEWLPVILSQIQRDEVDVVFDSGDAPSEN